MKNEENCFRPMNKEIIPPLFEWCIENYPGLCTLSINTTKSYLIMVYRAAILIFDTLVSFPLLCSNCALVALNFNSL